MPNMTQLYSNEKPKDLKKKKGPRKETIAFLLNYSKALSIEKYKGLECELILN